jgi:site-specific DNA recombinase
MTASERRKAKRDLKHTGAVVYLRVSTSKQADSGAGLEAQEAKCREHCARLGLDVLSIRTDAAMSGKDAVEKRPGLMAALEDVKANPGAVMVVYSLSRLARSQRIIWNLLDDRGEYRLALASATESFETCTPMGRAMLGMLGVWAQLEADLVSERTIAALEAVAERGTKLGAPTMIESTTEEGERYIDAEKVALVRRVQDLYATGDYSHRTLAEHLNQNGIASVTGRQWHARTVRVAINTALPA